MQRVEQVVLFAGPGTDLEFQVAQRPCFASSTDRIFDVLDQVSGQLLVEGFSGDDAGRDSDIPWGGSSPRDRDVMTPSRVAE